MHKISLEKMEKKKEIIQTNNSNILINNSMNSYKSINSNPIPSPNTIQY